MKRIIESSTYNTDTAVEIAEGAWSNDAQGIAIETKLYQNRAGVFFAVEETQQTYRDKYDQRQTRTSFEWQVIGDADAARRYCEKEGLTIHRDMGEMPPEAESGEPAATLYIRMPPTLKANIDKAAAGAKLSINAWAMRCMERCLSA